MNDLQKKELDLLRVFINICEEHKLQYFLVCGSALGAEKYRGFIPWDDDIDVALPRDDYEKFMQYVNELPEGVFLQNHITEKNFPNIISKMRNSNTTYIEKSLKNLEINHGVYIDIFPLDGYPEGKISQFIFEIRKNIYQKKIYTVVDVERKLKSKVHYYFFRVCGCHKRVNKIICKYEKMLKKYPLRQNGLWCNHGNWQGKKEYSPAYFYGNGCVREFEGVKVIIPAMIDEYLTLKYNDWKADLPQGEQIGHHFYEVMDLETSYKHYYQSKE